MTVAPNLIAVAVNEPRPIYARPWGEVVGKRPRRSARRPALNCSANIGTVAKQETIGARLKRLRLERGLSQRQLSSPGVSYAYISRIEADERAPSVKALRKMANKLGVTVEHLEKGTP